MMGVVVNDEYSLTGVGERRRCYCHIVEETEPHGLNLGRMMTGRAHDTECGIGLAAAEPINGFKTGASGVSSSVERSRRGNGVGIDAATTSLTHPLDQRDKLVGVYGPQQLERSEWGFDQRDHFTNIGPVNGMVHCREPLRAFGMHFACRVLKAPIIRYKQHSFILGHARP